jgi:hypothetical protein
MVLVGTYTEKDLIEGKDKIEIDKKQQETGLKFIKSSFIKKNGKISAIKVWVCDYKDFTL